jgi:hypothetical protein
MMLETNHKKPTAILKKTLLDLTDVCPLLTKQYTQVGLQIQYMLYNFSMVSLRIRCMVKSFGHPTYGL